MLCDPNKHTVRLYHILQFLGRSLRLVAVYERLVTHCASLRMQSWLMVILTPRTVLFANLYAVVAATQCFG